MSRKKDLRDEFAMAALQGLLANPGVNVVALMHTDARDTGAAAGGISYDLLAAEAYFYADIVLEHRDQ